MITNTLHTIVSHPTVYDLVQKLVGVDQVHQRLLPHLAGDEKKEVILDVGGGTGIIHQLLPQCKNYICLDLDPLKLAGFLHKYNDGTALLADATILPIANSSVSTVICMFLTHHLPDLALSALLQECIRVLKANGNLLIVDPVWNSNNFVGQLLWKYDRGSYPRTASQLHSKVNQFCHINYWESFKVYHNYVIGAAIKNQ